MIAASGNTETAETQLPRSEATGPPPATRPPSGGPRRLRALIIGTVVAVALAALLFRGLGSASGPGSGPLVGVGSVAPTFTIPSLTGGTPVDLDALGEARHRPVVLNFFASWCVPCQKETPLLAETARAEQSKGSMVQFVGVDVGDPPANAVPFVRQSGIAYPVGADSTFQVTQALYGLNAEPNTFFVDATGRVIGRVIGGLTQAELDKWLHRLAGASG